MEIIEIEEYSDEVLEALNELLPQLSRSAQPLTEEKLKEIISSESSHLLMAKENDEYYGSLTVVVFKIPTGNRAWIEDVVVSESARRKGIGKSLTLKGIELSKKYGAKTVDLTSRPSREEANVLYKKVGFQIRETNIYRYKNS